jgi:flavin reductase (DIM6/NTAB) family NADH-FMN oxidoreductase RutF
MEDASDPRRLRDAFGCFGTGVTLVSATNPEGGVTAVTANSFTSVSLEPPLLLFCLSKRSRRLPVFEHAEAYAVNVLHAGQERLSSELARGDGCEGLDWRLEAGRRCWPMRWRASPARERRCTTAATTSSSLARSCG